jgi:hypothetical protein
MMSSPRNCTAFSTAAERSGRSAAQGSEDLGTPRRNRRSAVFLTGSDGV